MQMTMSLERGFMDFIRITGTTDPLFTQFWDTYQEAFPLEEKRTLSAQASIFHLPSYHLDLCYHDNTYLGLLSWWKHDSFFYLEHFAVTLEKRSQGFGKAMIKAWRKRINNPIFLEIEKVVDAQTQRRLNFYLCLGFIENSYLHDQPSYYDGNVLVPLTLLSWPSPMTLEQYHTFENFFAAEVISHTGKSFIDDPHTAVTTMLPPNNGTN